jgi:hypothetical protein
LLEADSIGERSHVDHGTAIGLGVVFDMDHNLRDPGSLAI